METRSFTPDKKNRSAWLLFGLGLFLFVLGLLLRYAFPAATFNFRVVSAFGILAIAFSFSGIVRNITAKVNPTAARRMEFVESDERLQAIRRRAGNAAYFFSYGLTTIVLLIYSGMTAGQPGFDSLWWLLSALVVVPALFYLVMLVWWTGRE